MMAKQNTKMSLSKWTLYTFLAGAVMAILAFRLFENLNSIWLTFFIILACVIVIVGVHYYSKLIYNDVPLVQSNLGLSRGEEVLIEGEASMMHSRHVQSGVLFLTNHRIVFYKENSLPVIIPLDEIKETRINSSKKLLVSRTLKIRSLDETECNFFIDYPEDWQSLIDNQMMANQEVTQLGKTGSE